VNSFKNRNSESYWKWIFRTNDHLSQIVFIFVSKLNAQNARNFQLFEASTDIRIVYLNGIRIRYTDVIMLKLFPIMVKLFKNKTRRYNALHLFSIPKFYTRQKQVLHLDDPVYSKFELENIIKWASAQNYNNGESILICTNEYTKNWFLMRVKFLKVFIVEQGFQDIVPTKSSPALNFSCVYSSPYIDISTDKHGNHTTWGAEILITQIIPKLNRVDPDIQIHIIGQIGKKANHSLSKLHNVFTYGRVNFKENSEILSKCTIGIYPRTFDHKRSILKIFSYIGAGLPVVTFDLEDTRVIKDYNLGLSVNSIDDFVRAIVQLKEQPKILKNLERNIDKFRAPYTWQNLSKKMSGLITH